MTSEADTRATLSGASLHDMFATAATWLERNAGAINAINVFPVPDGDTGTNMTLTLKAAIEAAAADVDLEAGAAAAALAHGALMGARGNSGVILSQYLKGIAAAGAGLVTLDARQLAEALVQAGRTARSAVSNPVEGTILTVAQAAGAAAQATAATGSDVLATMAAAAEAAREAVERTPDLLPVLREAGVVDSGALGLSVILDGALMHLRGEPLPAMTEDAGRIASDWLASHAPGHGGGEPYGYCVEFVVSGAGLDEADLRDACEQLGSSVLVVGERELLHVHIHTDRPGRALELGSDRGSLSRVKVENMDEQAGQLSAAMPPQAPALGPFSVVAVAAGSGLAGALRAAGAEIVVTGGQTMNPSTRELLDAIEQTERSHVIILPNNKNIIWTAEQAAKLSGRDVNVVPTRSIPQGIAALLAISPDDAPQEALTAMSEAAGTVRTIEITRAARSVRIHDIPVDEGQPISLIDDELSGTAPTAELAAVAALEQLGAGPNTLLTVYSGAGVRKDRVDALLATLAERFAGTEIESLSGGQPFYDYIISVE